VDAELIGKLARCQVVIENTGFGVVAHIQWFLQDIGRGYRVLSGSLLNHGTLSTSNMFPFCS
jgi:hypothetical protein